ncbi:hypothetical protein Hdeb2414_s0018g00518751 [Helianthus debilis subsp. tardiflorus]
MEYIWSNPNSCNPPPEQGNVHTKLLQSGFFVGFSHEHSWKHLRSDLCLVGCCDFRRNTKTLASECSF